MTGTKPLLRYLVLMNKSGTYSLFEAVFVLIPISSRFCCSSSNIQLIKFFVTLKLQLNYCDFK